jgi:hypothetical protein
MQARQDVQPAELAVVPAALPCAAVTEAAPVVSPTATPAPSPVVSLSATPAPTDSVPPAAAAENDFRVRARISAIEKFVPLNADQRQLLERKFRAEISHQEDPAAVQSLDDILGKESADYYRQQTQAAFSRAQEEETDREVFYQSRKLALTAEQESAFRQALNDTEAEVNAGGEHPGTATTMKARMDEMLRENELREKLLNERLQTILSPDQYASYLTQQNSSSSADFEVFHELPK